MMIGYILSLMQGFRVRIALNAIAGMTRVIMGLCFVEVSKRAVDIATGQTEGNLMMCVVGLVVALLVELACSAISGRNAELSEAAMKNSLQQRLFSRLLMTSRGSREPAHTGDMMSRLTDDCRVAAECLCRTIPAMTVAAFQLVGAFAFLWYFSPILAVILLFLLPAFIIGGRMFSGKVRLLNRLARQIESRLQSRMQESLQHRILLQTYQQARRTVESIVKLHRRRYRLMHRRTNIALYSRTAVFAGFEFGYLTAFLWGIDGLRNGTVSFGLMTAYLQLAGQVQRPMAELVRLLPGLIKSHTAFSRLAEIEPMSREEATETEEQSTDWEMCGITIRDVTFAYPDTDRAVFKNFSHYFAPGSRTAIVGATGIGKSTLFRLILGLVKPQQGTILLTDVNGHETAVSAMTRSGIVYVPQGNSLLSGTIRQNLLIGQPDATEHEMREALHTAVADFVFDLKDGLETLCGEYGYGLSEGQAQRIAIARGLLRGGSILLLDEISASLDERTETILMRRLTEMWRKHTILIVTHRSKVMEYCDSTLQIQDGE